MDYYVNSKTEEKTIYEIYKACRLCGAGAGYKMPIIQNVVNISTDEIELKQKIRECVQIEVHQDDKMPPLICELCVDKVNDFYEFMDMCKQTNKKTRLRLGLPPQTLPSGAPDAGDCILGVTEPVYINENSNEAILTRKSKTAKNAKTKKQPEEVKVESKLRRKDEIKPSNILNTSRRSGRSKDISPPRSLRGTKRQSDDDISLSSFQKTRRSDAQGLKSILKKNTPEDEPRRKRSRDTNSRERNKSEANKKVKISLNNDKKSSKPEAKSSKNTSTRPAPHSYKCYKCKISFRTSQSLSNHMRIHQSPKVHKRMASPPPTRAEVKHKTRWCSKCDKTFSINIFKTHRCTKPFECGKCKRKIQTPQALISHERYCNASGDVRVPRKWLSMVRPLQVRIRRCDSLLDDRSYCDVSAVPHDFGLSKDCIYPYLNMSVRKLRIKSELAAYDSMVNIQDEIRDEFSYVHWDSESEVDSDMDITDSDSHLKTHNVKSLLTLALKVIYSPKMLGKMPRKLRKLKSEKPFESILNVSEIDNDMRRGIDNIINSLEDKSDISKTIDDDFFFNENKGPGVKNSDFDSIFHSQISEENSTSSISIATTEKINVKESIINQDESCNNGANSVTNGNNILDHDSILSRESVNINEYDSTSSKLEIENKIIEDKSENSENNTTNSIVHKDTYNIVHKEIKDTETNENNDPEEECITRERSEDRIENRLNTETEIIEKQSPVTEAKKDDQNSVETNLIKENDVKADEKDEKQVLDFKNDDNEIIDDCKNTDNESVNIKLECNDGQESIETRIGINEEDIENEHIKTFEASKVNGDLEVADKFNMDNLEDLSDTDMDDKKLMEALDAQIGENDTRSIGATGTETNI